MLLRLLRDVLCKARTGVESEECRCASVVSGGEVQELSASSLAQSRAGFKDVRVVFIRASSSVVPFTSSGLPVATIT